MVSLVQQFVSSLVSNQASGRSRWGCLLLWGHIHQRSILPYPMHLAIPLSE